MNKTTRNVSERAILTFFESFVATLCANLVGYNVGSIDELMAAATLILIPALAMGLSAAFNYIAQYYMDKKDAEIELADAEDDEADNDEDNVDETEETEEGEEDDD